VIFRGNIDIRGKHANYLKALSQERNEDSDSIKVFDTYLTAYFSAAVFGAKNGLTASVDTDSEISRATIYENAIATSQDFCDRCYRLVMLMDGRELSDKQRQENAFIHGFDGQDNSGIKENKQVFHAYARGGLEYLYDQLVKNPHFSLANLYANFTNFIHNLYEEGKE
jgi:hypothetical protein